MQKKDFFNKLGLIDDRKLPQISSMDLLLLLLGVPFSYILPFIAFLFSGFFCFYCMIIIMRLFTNSYLFVIMLFTSILCGAGLLAAFFIFIKNFFLALLSDKCYEYGKVLDLTKDETLFQDIQEVCHSLHIKPPDNIVLSFTADFYVTQRKINISQQVLKGRTLVFGIVFLKYLNRNEIKSILAHEMAHFTGKDTLFSIYIGYLYKNIHGILRNFEQLYQEDELWFVCLSLYPISFILRKYLYLYTKLEKKVSRDREKRADYIASILYGKKTFKNALTKLSNIQDYFGVRFEDDFVKAYEENLLFKNYFIFFDECIKEINYDLSDTNRLKHPTKELDEHYCFSERINYLPNIPSPTGESGYEIYDPLWEEEITEAMVNYFVQIMKILEYPTEREESGFTT